MKQSNNANFKAMEWLPADAVDPSLARLIDPDQALQENDVFLPRITFSKVEIIWKGLWLGICVLGIFSMSFQQISSRVFSSPDQKASGFPIAIAAMLVLALCFGAWKIWKSLHASVTQLKLFKAGRYRNGLFVLNDGLMLHNQSEIFFVEKKNIRRIDVVPRGRAEPLDVFLVLAKNDDELMRINLTNWDLDLHGYSLKASLVNWINTGNWEIKTAFSALNMPEINRSETE